MPRVRGRLGAEIAAYSTAGGRAKMWAKVVCVGEHDSLSGFYPRGPPMSTASFGAEQAKRRFTNGADASIVVDLYRRALHDGLGGCTQLVYARPCHHSAMHCRPHPSPIIRAEAWPPRTPLRYPRADWFDTDLATLADTLEEVLCPKVTLLKLT